MSVDVIAALAAGPASAPAGAQCAALPLQWAPESARDEPADGANESCAGGSEQVARSEAEAFWQDVARDPGREAFWPPDEVRLAQLAGAAGPLRRLLAALAERMLATRGYERLCYARLTDYARERPGISARQLHELARVGRALLSLPRIEAALMENRLPWSKVRLIARVATADDELTWVARAEELSTRGLEQEVRNGGARTSAQGSTKDATDEAANAPARPAGATGVRAATMDVAEGDGPSVRVALRCTPAMCEKWAVGHEMAERVAGEKLTRGQALEWVMAEVASALPVHPRFVEGFGPPFRAARETTPRAGERAAASAPRAPSRALPREVEALAQGLDDADAFELDRRLRQALGLEQTLDAAMAPLLRVLASRRYEWLRELQSFEAHASDQLGLCASKARALVRLDRAGEVCPELREAYRGGRISWVKAQHLLPLLRLDVPGEWRPAWLAWARRVTVRRLAADVERALRLRASHHAAFHRALFDPAEAMAPIPPEEQPMCAQSLDVDSTQQLVWRVPRAVARLFAGVRETLRVRLAREGVVQPRDDEVFGVMIDLAVRAWLRRPPGARRPDPVIERDLYSCSVPGCTSRRNLHDHHIRFRSRGGSHVQSNRISLCAFHHQRGIHGAGGLRVWGRAPEGVLFELGVRPGRPALARYRWGDVMLAQA